MLSKSIVITKDTVCVGLHLVLALSGFSISAFNYL